MESSLIHRLPTELLVAVLSHVEYTPRLQSDLRLINRRIKTIIDNYQSSISKHMLHSQFSWALGQYPGLVPPMTSHTTTSDWHILKQIFRRTAVLANIKARCSVLRHERCGHNAWLTGLNLAYQHAGLLLLYRLADASTYDLKSSLLQSLPRTSLAILHFALLFAVNLLRVMGPTIRILDSERANMTPVELLSDTLLASEELILDGGPEFLLRLMHHDKDAVLLLKKEVVNMPARQLPHAVTGEAQQPTLIATLRQAFAKSVKCEMRYNHEHMWNVLDEECASSMGSVDAKVRDAAVETVVNGEDMTNDRSENWECAGNDQDVVMKMTT